jgi:hypothetical protein
MAISDFGSGVDKDHGQTKSFGIDVIVQIFVCQFAIQKYKD